MVRTTLAAVFISALSISTQAQARGGDPAGFWQSLDRSGSLSAGWVQVLPVLATACALKLDSGELNSTLVDLSQLSGNDSYATHLYSTLYELDRKRAQNRFVTAWNAMFKGNQQEACSTAEALWGNGGKQFPGVLKREVSADVTSSIRPNTGTSCQ